MIARKLHILKGRVIISIRIGNGDSSSERRDIPFITLGNLAGERAGKHWLCSVIFTTFHDVIIGITGLRAILNITDSAPRIQNSILIDEDRTSDCLTVCPCHTIMCCPSNTVLNGVSSKTTIFNRYRCPLNKESST